tara:strand:+ start:2658 stop:4343 length:1686 start_codon:yes stop_codon:yes gene_type:complete
MVDTENIHKISQMGTGSSLAVITDNADFPHTGLIKALNQMSSGNIVVKTGADFDINQTGGDIVVDAGKILRNGMYHSVNTKTFADTALSTSHDKGYHLLVVADGREGGETVNNLYLRTPTAANVVADFKLGDTIVAMIEYASTTSAGSRLIQFFTTSKEENGLSIAYANSNVYTETMSVIGNGDRTTFKNKIANADIRFVLAADTAQEKFEILTDDDSDGDEGDTSVFSVDGLGAIAAGNLTYDQDDMVLSSAAAQLQVKDTTNNYAVTIKGGGGPRIQMGDTDSDVDTFMDIGAYGGVNNIDTQTRDFKIHGGTHATHFYIDESAANIGIGVAPITNSKLTVEGVLALDEVSAPTNTADYGQLYANADNDLHYMDGAGTNTPLLKGGTHSIWVPAEAISPRNNAGCADLTLTAAATNGRPDIRGLAFDGASREHAQFTIAMPKMWDGGDVTARFYWTTIASGTGNVMWAIRGVSLSNDDAIDTAFGSLAVTAPDGVIATKDVHITDETGACTIAGSPAALDLCCFEVVREGDQSNDTLNSVDCVLLGVKLFYAIDKGNDA